MTTKNRYHYSSHCVFNLGYHIIWCPKYRRKVLVNGIDERLKELLCQKGVTNWCYNRENGSHARPRTSICQSSSNNRRAFYR